MTVRELLMIPVGVWKERKRERQEVLDGFGWIFEEYYPFYKRIWWRYLFWGWAGAS